MLIVVFPFPYDFFNVHTMIIQSVLEEPIQWLKVELLHWKKPYAGLESDTSSLYVLVLLVMVVALFLAIVLELIRKPVLEINTKSLWIKQIPTYFLALILLKYGLTKIFGGQFYEPEPNILFTEFGLLDKDILYWSTMGRSYGYNLFLGLVEVIVGVGILYNKSRFISLLVSLFVVVNILAVNLSFDISVKILTAFLVVVNLYLLLPEIIKRWKAFKNYQLDDFYRRKQPRLTVIQKTFTILMLGAILLESIYPHATNQFKFDWQMEQHPFCGAYRNIDPNSSKDFWGNEYLFVHRSNYLVFKNEYQFQDFHFEDLGQGNFKIKDYYGGIQLVKVELQNDTLNFYKDQNTLAKYLAIDMEKRKTNTSFRFTID